MSREDTGGLIVGVLLILIGAAPMFGAVLSSWFAERRRYTPTHRRRSKLRS